jgi:DNA-dependent RNA polymerase auxiliary subunit epsilon
MLVVVFYLAGEGKSPVREYLDSLDAKHAAKVLWTFCRDEMKEHENRKAG